MADFKPIHRGQANELFRTDTRDTLYKRGQSVPYDVNGSPSGATVANADYGDITVAAGVWTIDAGVVTLAKQANMATASVVYRKTAGAGVPEVQTLATLKTDLGLTGTNSGDQTTSGTANQISVANGATNPTLSLPAAITTPGSLAVTTTLSCNGNATIGDAVGDAHIVNGSLSGISTASFVKTTDTINTITVGVSASAVGATDTHGGKIIFQGTGGAFQLGSARATYNTSLGTGELYLTAMTAAFAAIDIVKVTTTGLAVSGAVSATGNVTGLNLSGTNTGDQTSIAGISGTLAQFNTAISDADIQPLDIQLTDLAALAYAANALKVIRVNAGETAFELATPASPPAAPPTFTTVEVDLGGAAGRSGKFNIAGAGMTIGKPVMIQQAVGPYTGKGTLADEAEMDQLLVTASVISATVITAYYNSQYAVARNFKFDYLIGA